MAWGLPSTEEVRDMFITGGMDPEAASREANAWAERVGQKALRGAVIGVGTGRLAGMAPAAASSVVPRAIQVIQNLARAPSYQPYRAASGKIYNLAASAPTVVRTSAGQLVKLAPGEAVPAGATILNTVEAPIASIIGGVGGGVGVPVVLAYQTRSTKPESYSDSADVGGMYADFNLGAPVFSGPAAPITTPPERRPDSVAPSPDSVAPSAAAPMPPRRPDSVAPSAAAPMPPRRPDSVAPQPPSRELMEAARMDAVRREWEEFNRSESPAAFVRASKLMQSVMPQAEARGGGVSSKGASKPDAVHKALEIIHHLLIHGR